VGYFHLAFSVPHSLVPLVWQNKKVLFSFLFEAMAATFLEVAADPKHLGAAIGFLKILPTRGQTLEPHPHLHCVAPGGRLSSDHQRWIASCTHFFSPLKVNLLSRVFRGKFVAGLRPAARSDGTTFLGDQPECGFTTHICTFSAAGDMVWTLKLSNFTVNVMQFDKQGRLYLTGSARRDRLVCILD
jgi:hypothetical protein